MEMVLSGESPGSVELVLRLADSVRPNQLSTPVLYRRALQDSLPSPGHASSEAQEHHLDLVLSAISQHETSG